MILECAISTLRRALEVHTELGTPLTMSNDFAVALIDGLEKIANELNELRGEDEPEQVNREDVHAVEIIRHFAVENITLKVRPNRQGRSVRPSCEYYFTVACGDSEANSNTITGALRNLAKQVRRQSAVCQSAGGEGNHV